VGAGDVLVVAEIEIAPPGVSLVAGTTQQVQATARTSSGIAVPNRQVTWSSDDLAVAAVSSTGMITGVATGSSRIHATVDGVRGSIPVTVTPKPVATVAVVPDQITILVGESGDLTATPLDAQGQPVGERVVTFASDNPLIATVSNTGHVTGVGPGLTVVRATVDGKTGSANVAVNDRPAAQLDFISQPETGAAGVPLPALRVAVQNDQGGTVTAGALSVTISLADNPTGAVLSGTRTVSAVNGVAIFTDLNLNRAGTGYTLRATSGTLKPADTAPFAIVAGPAAALGISVQPSATSPSGVVLAEQPVVRVYDANGNAVAKAGVQVTAALQGTGGTLDGTRTIVTNPEGVATFINLALSGSPGTYTLLFAAPGLTAVASSGIALTGVATRLTMTQQPAATAQSGVPLSRQPVVQLRDVQGNAIAQVGVPVAASINSGGGALSGVLTALTDAAGRATFANLSIGGAAGTRTLLFSAPGLTSVVSENVAVGPGPASALAITTAPPSTTTSGAVLSPAPVARVVDAFGNPVDPNPEVPVTVAIASGTGGSLGGQTSVTTVNGVAQFSGLILNGPSGSYSLRFSGAGLTPAVSSTIAIGGVTPTALFVVTEPSPTAPSGVAFAQQPVVEIRDNLGNPAPTSGTLVTAAIASGGGTLLGATALATNGSGQAVFTDLAISGTPGPRTLSFTASGLAGATSSAINLGAPPPGALKILTEPSSTAVSGVVLPGQPVVEFTDVEGGPISGATITATINNGPAGSSLSGATALTDASGVASFSALAITGGAGSYTLRFQSGDVAVTSATVTINPVPVKLVLAPAPGASATSGAPLPTQPAVQIADGNGVAVPAAGATVTVVIASGPSGATLAGASAVSDAAGLATFSGLAITGLIGTYTLRFQSTGLTSVTSGNIVLGVGAPALLTMFTEPPKTAINDQALGNSSVVRVRDAGGNSIPNIVVTAALASGAGIVKGTLDRTTASNGRATFNDLELVGLIGPYTLAFTAPGGAFVVSRVITLSPGAAAALALQVEPSASAKSGVNLAVQPTVDLRDSGGNLVTSTGVKVDAALETVSGAGTFGGTTQVSTVSGVASFTNLRITGSGTFRIRFTSNGMTSVTSTTIVVTQ